LKTINTKKGRFAGNVAVNDKIVYIDTSDGTGFAEVFQEMEVHISMLARDNCSWSVAARWDLEDLKQDISFAMLEAIVKYDPKYGAKLSTFLWTVGRNRAIDGCRKSIRGRTEFAIIYDEADFCPNPDFKIELEQRTKSWDDRWKSIMLRIFVSGDLIADVAKDENFTPWGLTRAIRRKLKEARKV